MFEAARMMHPQAVESLLLHRRTIWRIKYVPRKDLVEWVLDEAPTVHAGFVDFVFEHSSESALMSKRLLSDGSKQFDPDERVTDYEQYNDLMLLLQQKLICTTALGNQPPRFIPPWTPDLLRHRFGLDADAGIDVEQDHSGPTMAVVQRANEKKNGLVDLSANESTTVTPAKEEKRRIDPELTDEEWDAITKENAAHAEKYQS